MTFDSGGFITKTDDLKLYQEQKVTSRKKWQKLKEAIEVISSNMKRWGDLLEIDPEDYSDEDTDFMDRYKNYTKEIWLDYVESAENKCQQALDLFAKVSSELENSMSLLKRKNNGSFV